MNRPRPTRARYRGDLVSPEPADDSWRRGWCLGAEVDTADAERKDRSGRYLLFFTAALIVAAIGAILIPITNHDVLGTALLLGGDTAIVAGFVAYIRKL